MKHHLYFLLKDSCRVQIKQSNAFSDCSLFLRDLNAPVCTSRSLSGQLAPCALPASRTAIFFAFCQQPSLKLISDVLWSCKGLWQRAEWFEYEMKLTEGFELRVAVCRRPYLCLPFSSSKPLLPCLRLGSYSQVRSRAS